MATPKLWRVAVFMSVSSKLQTQGLMRPHSPHHSTTLSQPSWLRGCTSLSPPWQAHLANTQPSCFVIPSSP